MVEQCDVGSLPFLFVFFMSQVILVTGALSGLGKSIATHLHAMGHTVYGTTRNFKKYTDLPSFHLLELDLNNKESIDKAVALLKEKEGKVDVLINNAGVGIAGPIEETNLDEIRNNFEINFFKPLYIIQQILPIMRASSSGIIINITSIAGHMGLPFRGVYSASKSALSILTEALRLETVGQGIRIMTLAPGDYATDIASRRYHAPVIENSPYQQAYQHSLDMMNKHISTGNNPIEIAHKVAKLLNIQAPKPHYAAGSFLQKFSLVLKRILPQKTYEKILKNHYRL